MGSSIIEVLKDNLKLTAAIEFVIGLYSFNIWFEFLSIPVAFIILLLIELSKREKEYLKLSKFLNIIVLITVIVLTFYVFSKLISDYDKYLNSNTLHKFLLSPLLAILFMPFLFLLSLYNNYEVTFAMIQNKITPVDLLQYAKRQAVFKFNINLKGLERWKYSVFLEKINNKEDVLQSIKNIINLQNTEKDPPIIDPSKGWSPYLAKEFLKEHNIATGYYSNYSEDEWSASSPPFKLDDNILPNDISYYVEGTEKIANSVELVLSIYDGIVNTNANESLVIYSEILYQKVFNKPFPENFKIDILNGCNFVIEVNLFEISLKREEWNNLNKGYDLSFKIKFNHYLI